MIPILALRKLYPSIDEHRRVEARVNELLDHFLAANFRKQPPKPARAIRYAQRHIFSILFLAIYRALGIPEERRIPYGVVNHCLRGIITGTDNILDNEYKEMLPLAFPEAATRFKSVMHILLFDRFLGAIIDDMIALNMVAPGGSGRVQQEIFNALVPIGAEEAQEEGGISEIITPAAILNAVHMYKGGKLLCLSFVVPRLLEQEKVAPLLLAEQGVYRIGMALQVIDDLTDYYEDMRAKNHNYLISTIHHTGTCAEQATLAAALRQRPQIGPPIEELYPLAVARVMEQAIGEAMQGFALLQQAGFWMDSKSALALIRHLFQLRGVNNLLPFFPKTVNITLNLGAAHD